ncbi:hypothetical protein [Azospirillum lipoferum]|uniref:Uncharacterized protein n=1 Tax=Azospirillum lipoferum (strain 4B) TaxID=862719 RepID=G7ZI26_AZOL4|nr:hypothetical protein [Azospirillum lipoferum]CBS91091.1 protein of unknown function [Azospirillum lipoferum 4B]
MEYFLEWDASGIIVVARLPADIQKHLGAKTTRVFLSSETRDSHKKHGWTPEAFARLQEILDQGEVREDRERHVVVARHDLVWWCAVVKVTVDRRGVYLQSLRRSNNDQIANMRARGVLVRPCRGKVAAGERDTPHGPEGYPASLTVRRHLGLSIAGNRRSDKSRKPSIIFHN